MFESQLEDSIVLKTGAAVGVGVGGKYVWFGALAQSLEHLSRFAKEWHRKRTQRGEFAGMLKYQESQSAETQT